MIRVLADEHFPFESINILLRSAGYDIKAVAIEMPGARDRDILSYAIEERRIIVTFDSDYGELIFKHGIRPPQGVMYMREIEDYAEPEGAIVCSILQTAGFNTDFKLTVVHGLLWRQRAY